MPLVPWTEPEPTGQQITAKEMCQTIVRADFLRDADGVAPTAEEIFNYSPTGDLSKMFEWYEVAKVILETKQ